MQELTKSFLKIFFRNYRAMFFVLFLPAGVFLIATFLGFEQIIRFELEELKYTDFLLAGIIAFALMNTGVYTMAYSLVDSRRQQVLKRLFLTPLTAGQFLSSQILARFLIGLIQSAVLIGLGLWLFGIRLDLNLLWLPVLVFVGSTAFLCFGFLIASIARDYEEAAPYTAIIGITLTFLGDIFFPVQNLPRLLARAAEWLPVKPLSELLRLSLVGIVPEDLTFSMVVLLAWLLGLFILARAIFAQRAYK